MPIRLSLRSQLSHSPMVIIVPCCPTRWTTSHSPLPFWPTWLNSNRTTSLLERWQREETVVITRGIDTRVASLDASIELPLKSERMQIDAPSTFMLLSYPSLLSDGIVRDNFTTVLRLSPVHDNPLRSLSALLRSSLGCISDNWI